jgi:hypothetical protein
MHRWIYYGSFKFDGWSKAKRMVAQVALMMAVNTQREDDVLDSFDYG